MRRRSPPFSKAELREFATTFIKNWAHLEDIHQDLVKIADRLESIAIMLGSPRR